MSKHPTQPTEMIYGVERFKANAIVKYLLDHGPFDMNHIASHGFTDEDRRQFAQLLGYSVEGYSGLSYASQDDEAKDQPRPGDKCMFWDDCDEIEARPGVLSHTDAGDRYVDTDCTVWENARKCTDAEIIEWFNREWFNSQSEEVRGE